MTSLKALKSNKRLIHRSTSTRWSCVNNVNGGESKRNTLERGWRDQSAGYFINIFAMNRSDY